MPGAFAYYVENLTASVWRDEVAPRLAAARADGEAPAVWYFDADEGGIAAAGAEAERLEFRLLDIVDEAGSLLRMRIAFGDFFDVQDDIVTTPEFLEVLDDPDCVDHLPQYIAKQTAAFDTFTDFAVWRGLLLVQIAAWHARRVDMQPVLLMGRKIWQGPIARYAEKSGVDVAPIGEPRSGIKATVLSVAGPRAGLARAAYLRAKDLTRRRPRPSEQAARDAAAIAPPRDGRPLVAFEYYGHLNLDHPEMHSDAFWWQKSDLPAERVVATFALSQDTLDEAKARELASHGMAGVALDPRAASLAGAPTFHHASLRTPRVPRLSGGTPERRWLKQQIAKYAADRAYWRDFFTAYGVKAWVTWFKYGAVHAAIADALANVGGALALYQRGFEEISSPEAAVYADLFFGSSPGQAEVELGSGSNIDYHVACGYVGGHRFELLKPAAVELREKLRAAGADHVAAFFDEGSAADERWHTGHGFMRANYRFLCEKVLTEPWFGVVFKPKTPGTLRARLGEDAELLARAEATGRCFVCEGGTVAGSYAPAFAALASDIAVHGHLVAATAGVEAALTGTPTLLMDREGWPVSRFYDLGVGRVVFRDWDTAWAALHEQWRGAGVPGLGEWGEELDRIDPFRDGRAAERMGTYLKWFLDAIAAGRGKDAALAECAERYADAWGSEMITPVRSDYPRTPSARTGGVRP